LGLASHCSHWAGERIFNLRHHLLLQGLLELHVHDKGRHAADEYRSVDASVGDVALEQGDPGARET
jgi:hypothetical protein